MTPIPRRRRPNTSESIKADVKWLGFDWGDNLYFASNYFQFFHDCAVHLIKNGLAYVDEESPEEIKLHRGNVQTPGTASKYRDRSIEENLALFEKMRTGGFKEGQAVLRAKIGLTSSNMNMRDPVMYRIMHAHHHNTGSEWCIYPMYDFAHPLEDALEHITHSLCTLEFENHRPLYNWFIENCPVPSQPRQIEFARLSLTYTIMSKRKLLQLVQETTSQAGTTRASRPSPASAAAATRRKPSAISANASASPNTTAPPMLRCWNTISGITSTPPHRAAWRCLIR